MFRKMVVCGIVESKLIMDQCTKAIGLVDPDLEVETLEKYHVERHHDIMTDTPGWLKPTMEQFERILDFSKDFTPDDYVMFHCSAGIARSTATAIMVLMQHGATAKDAFQMVYDVRPHMNPNSLILTFADELLEQNGSLLEYYKQWRHEKRVNPQAFAGQQKDTGDAADIAVMKSFLLKL